MFFSAFFVFLLVITKIKNSKIRIGSSIIWIIICLLFIFMSIFSDAVMIFTKYIGFTSSASFLFFALIGFLFVHAFYTTIQITVLNDKIKNLNHYIAMKEYCDKNSSK